MSIARRMMSLEDRLSKPKLQVRPFVLTRISPGTPSRSAERRGIRLLGPAFFPSSDTRFYPFSESSHRIHWVTVTYIIRLASIIEWYPYEDCANLPFLSRWADFLRKRIEGRHRGDPQHVREYRVDASFFQLLPRLHHHQTIPYHTRSRDSCDFYLFKSSSRTIHPSWQSWESIHPESQYSESSNTPKLSGHLVPCPLAPYSATG